MYRDGGGERARCEQHGLSYDPRTQEGCSLCRREKKSRVGPTLFAILGVASLALGGLRLALHFKNTPTVPKNVAVGGSCQGGPNACVAGADCLTPSGTLSLGYGECVKRCAADPECTLGTLCRAMPGVAGNHCVAVAALGERCSGMSVCEGGDCVLMVGKGAWCLKPCSAAPTDCPAGTVCQLASPHYCVPFP